MQLSGNQTLLLCLLAGASACVLLLAVRRQQQQQQVGSTPAATTSSTLKDAGITEDACLDWLRANMPKRDRGKLSEARLRSHTRLALAARTASAWAAAVPLELWLNDVLPYRSVDEPLDSQDWRPMFFDRFMPLVSEAGSLVEAAQLLNSDIWAIWGLHFVPDQTPEIMSVEQVLDKGYASCTGLSIFLVNACRAVGIPARVAGTPSWLVDRRDSPEERFNNHNWVEVWDGRSWSFTGACEYNPAGLNRTWFFPQPAKGQLPGDHWHAIYAASFKPTGTPFPLAWSPEDNTVPGVDVTQAYLDAQPPPTAAGQGAAEAGAVAAGAAAAAADGTAADGTAADGTAADGTAADGTAAGAAAAADSATQSVQGGRTAVE